MTAEPSSVRSIRWDDSTAIVELSGDVDMHQTPKTHRAIVGVCDRKPKTLVVSLEDVPYIDSSGIGMLVDVFRRLKTQGAVMRLCGLNERVRGVFEITKLDRFFLIYAGLQEALAG